MDSLLDRSCAAGAAGLMNSNPAMRFYKVSNFNGLTACSGLKLHRLEHDWRGEVAGMLV